MTQLTSDATPGQIMATLAEYETGLQLIEDPREAASFVKQADALRYLAQKAQAGKEVQNCAAELALRARRRAGELLAAVDLKPGPKTGDDPTLGSIGISANDSSRWQALAAVPEERFDRHLAEAHATGELTTAGVIRLASAIENQHRREDVLGVSPAEGRYRCLAIDPPWPVKKIEREVRPNQVTDLSYPTMSLEEIGELPIPDLADPLGCHVYLWVTHRFLPSGLRLFDAWGVNYQCVMTWVKNVGFTPYSWMYSTEHVLFGRIGSLDLLKNGLRLDFQAATTGHSEKPDVFYERVSEASPEPRLEMFARRPHEGFVPWGNQVADVG